MRVGGDGGRPRRVCLRGLALAGGEAPLRGSGELPEFIDAVDARLRGPRFRVVPVDDRLVETATTLARVTRLRAYDAVYCAVAVSTGIPLLTLDREVVERIGAIHPDAVVPHEP